MTEVRQKILQYLYDNRGQSFIVTSEISSALELDNSQVIQEAKYLIGKGLANKGNTSMLSGDFNLSISSEGIDRIEDSTKADHDGLAVEFTKISRELKDKLHEADEKANSRGLLYSGVAITLKINLAGELLEISLKKIAEIYNSDSDMARIESYLLEKQEEIIASIKVHDPSKNHSELVVARINEIKGLARNVQINSKKSEEKNNKTVGTGMPWWLQQVVIPITVGLVILLIGAYAFGVGL